MLQKDDLIKLIMEQTPGQLAYLGLYKGLGLEVFRNESEFQFLIKLRADQKPSRAEAENYIAELRKLYAELLEEFADFRSLVEGKSFGLELYVFSGQMDFTVARADQNEIEWLYSLES